MKAWLLLNPGSPAELTLGETEDPRPGPGEIRVQVHAVGLNPADYKLLSKGAPGWRYPFIPGLDVAGVVDAVGEGVSAWRGGDRVFYHGNLARPGGFAELAVTTAHTVTRIPESLSFTEAASIPCAGLTAYHALHRRLRLRRGQSLLVHAGAGGVGSFAIPLARQAGLRVLTTCSSRNADYVRALGAEVVIDYRRQDVRQAVMAATDGRGVDAILESRGPQVAARDLELLAFNGAMACLLGLPEVSRLQPFTVSPSLHEISLGAAHLYGSRADQEDLARMGDELAALIVQGAVRLPNLERIPWQQIPAGLEKLAEGHVRGKIVARVRAG